MAKIGFFSPEADPPPADSFCQKDGDILINLTDKIRPGGAFNYAI
ncbi:MAG: hypothetical protein UX72_C0024G0003 [Parcubacteria group bacterium GW2011_GWA2_47_10]|nr:MAG: hypothetical protein UX72_C0024G0003 [Parcubacteria group bacterium GW2011_GWA2_47_10]